MIIVDADNHPPMLEKSLYDLWKSRMELYVENWENGRMILNSLQNGPLVWPSVKENGTTRTKKVTVQKVQGRQGQNYAGLVILMFNQGDDPIACLKKEISFLTAIASLRVTVQKVQGRQGQNYAGQSAQTVHILTKSQVFYDDTHKQTLGYQNPFYLKKAQRIKPNLYDDSVISSQHVASPVFDDDETLILEEELLVYVQDTCPNAYRPSEKMIVVTPMNKVKSVRITPKKLVHLKETTSTLVDTSKPEIKVYSRRPKQIKSVGSSKKAKIVESKNANNSKPNHLWGSNATDVPSSSSLVNDRLSRLSSADLDTMSMDDLYNNLKVYELEVKEMSSSSSNTHNMAFVSSLNNNSSSTNRAVNTSQAVNIAYGVSTASTQVNATYSINIDNLSDVFICSFFASQPNNPKLVHEDLEQIYPGDMEEMDLRWQMAMLTMKDRSNKSFPAFRMKSVSSTSPLEKCCELRKLDSISYYARDGASRSIDVDTGESAVSTALGSAATRNEHIAIVGGLMYSSNMGRNK
nr:hypothetical protein [Tanacetum cinerariifolium]